MDEIACSARPTPFGRWPWHPVRAEEYVDESEDSYGRDAHTTVKNTPIPLFKTCKWVIFMRYSGYKNLFTENPVGSPTPERI